MLAKTDFPHSICYKGKGVIFHTLYSYRTEAFRLQWRSFRNISKYEYPLTEGADRTCDILCNLVTLLKAKNWIQEKMARNKVTEHTRISIIILNVCDTDTSSVHLM